MTIDFEIAERAAKRIERDDPQAAKIMRDLIMSLHHERQWTKAIGDRCNHEHKLRKAVEAERDLAVDRMNAAQKRLTEMRGTATMFQMERDNALSEAARYKLAAMIRSGVHAPLQEMTAQFNRKIRP